MDGQIDIKIDKYIDRQINKQLDVENDPFIFGKEELENGELQDVINSLDGQYIDR